VPTVRGYRYFVEHLMTRADLPERVQQAIRRRFRLAGRDPVRWLRLSAAVVAHTSGAAGIVASTARGDVPQLYHAGLTEILGAPEFADGHCLRVLVGLLEYGTGLLPVIDGLPDSGVEVLIGGEPPLEKVPHVTLVLSRFGGTVPEAGVLGVVGPTRLPYERAVPAVGFVADLMTQLLMSEAG
jgi:transcriptional regulator of heat shock response